MSDNYSNITSFQNGRYTVIKKLGEGGKGVVFKCQDNTLGRIVAVKLIKGDALDSETYSRLMREAQTTAKLSHPNIMSIYDLISEGDRFLMVIEYVEGKTLDAHISDLGGKMPLQEALRISMKLCNALQYAHEKGILHRDIKPENIMIDRNGEPKLMDFGLAKSFDSPGLTHAGTIVGTPAYLSPESALGKEADARSDLYSLGCVLYQMVTGQPPFMSDDTLKLIYSHIHDTPTDPSSINQSLPRQMNVLIMKAISKNPNDRFQTAGEMYEALQSVGSLISVSGNDGKALQLRQNPIQSKSSVQISPHGSLIGLESQIETLREIVDRSVIGQGRSAMILGETGLGKTRLSSEVRDYAILRGMRTITVRCRENLKNIPQYVFSEIMRDYLYNSPSALVYKVCSDYGDVAVKLYPELEARLGKIVAPVNSDPEYLKVRFHEGVAQIILNISNEVPLCIIVEDVQFADSSSAEILKTLADKVSSMRLALIVTGNKSDAESKLMIEDLESTRNFIGLELSPLDREGTRLFLSSYLSEPVNNISSQFLDFIYGRTGGNPLYIEEVLKFLIDRKIIFKNATGSWDRKPIDSAGIPGSLIGLIRERLSGIDEYSNNLLIHGSIIGIEFDVDVLSDLLGDHSDKFFDSLEELIQRGILVEKKTFIGGIRLFFANPQIYYYFRDQFSFLKQRRLHQRIAEIMSRRNNSEDIASFAEIANHFLEGGQPEKAVSYLIKIADLWRQSYNAEAALQKYYEVYEILKSLQRGEQSDIHTRELGEVCLNICSIITLTGVAGPFETYWKTGLQVFQQTGDVHNQAKMLIYNVFKNLQGTEMSVSFLEQHSEDKGLEYLIAEMGFSIASGYWYQGDLSNSRKYYDWTRNYIEKKKVQSEYRILLDMYVGTAIREIKSQDDIDWIIEIADSMPALNVMRTAQYVDSVIFTEFLDSMYGRRWAGTYFDFYANFLAQLKMEPSSSEHMFKEGLERYGKNFGPGYLKLYLSEYIQMVLAPCGRWGDADKIIEEYGIEDYSSINDVYSKHIRGMISLYRSLESLYRGPLTDEVKALASLIREEPLQFISHSNDLIPRLYLETDNLKEAIDYTEEVLEKLSKEQVTTDNFFGSIILRSFAVELYSRSGMKEKAEHNLTGLKEIASHFSERWINAFTKYADGFFQSVFGDISEAIEEIEYAVMFFKDSGYKVRYAASSLVLAQMYQKNGDRVKGSANVSNAIEIFTELDCPGYVRKCLGLMDLLKA